MCVWLNIKPSPSFHPFLTSAVCQFLEILTDPPSLHSQTQFKNITFRYPARPDPYILGGPDKPEGFSLRIPVGQTVAFVGQSGSGKSTTVALTMRFYDPEAGTVCLDGMDLKEINVKSLRQHISYVGQEVRARARVCFILKFESQ